MDHPGVFLKKQIESYGLSMNKAARACGFEPVRLGQIYKGKRKITADTAVRLGKLLDVDPKFFLGLQSSYDIQVTQEKLCEELDLIVPLDLKEF